MRLVRLLAAVSLVLTAAPASAYEGAGHIQEQEAAPPPKQAKLTKAPTIKKQVEAIYPPDLAKTAVPPLGMVKLQVTIDADGHVPGAKVTQSSGYPTMDQSALATIKQFEFTPAELDGKPAAIRLEYVFHFVPPPPPPPPPKPNEPPPPPPVNFTGRVLERGTRDPLEHANVYLPESGLHAETDRNGHFEIRGVPLGVTKVEASESNHRKSFTTETIKEGKVTDATYYLWKKIEGEFEVTIRGDKVKKDVSERSLTSAELTSVPGSYGDPIRVLEDMPGVARTPYGVGALLVRGSNPGDSQTLIDGVPVPLLFHFAGGPSVVNPSFVGGVDFFPGAYGARYGRAIAGIVDVYTKAANPTNYHGDISIDLLQSSFYLEGPISKEHNWGTIELSARRSYIDLWLPTLLKLVETPGQAIIIASPVYWDYQARYSLKLGRSQFEISAFGSDDQLAVSQAGTVQTQGFDIDEHQAFHKFKLRWTTTTEDGWHISVLPSAGPEITAFQFSQQISGSLTDWNLNLRAFAKKDLLKNLSFEAGIEINADLNAIQFIAPTPPTYEQFPGENPNTGFSHLNNNANQVEEAVYSEVVWNPFLGLKLIPGIRVENYNLSTSDVVSVEPRAGIRYEFPFGTTLKAGWGIYRQPPAAQYLAKGYGNPNLGLSESQQSVIGIEQKIVGGLSADLEGYYNWRDHLVSGSQNRALFYDNSGRGYVYGLEVLIKQEVTKRAFGWISYTLSRSLQYDPTTRQYLPTTFDETHILTVVASYKFDFGIQAGLRFQLATGRPATATVGSTFDNNIQGYNAVLGGPGASRLPTFNQLDLRIEKLWTFPAWTFTVFLDVQNVYNAPNEEAILYNYNYSQFAYLRGLPILPTFGFSGHF